jgi:hypothetical protein
MENESELQPVPLRDKNQVILILGPKGDQNSREIGYGERGERSCGDRVSSSSCEYGRRKCLVLDAVQKRAKIA